MLPSLLLLTSLLLLVFQTFLVVPAVDGGPCFCWLPCCCYIYVYLLTANSLGFFLQFFNYGTGEKQAAFDSSSSSGLLFLHTLLPCSLAPEPRLQPCPCCCWLPYDVTYFSPRRNTNKVFILFSKCISRAQTVRPCLDQQRNMKS